MKRERERNSCVIMTAKRNNSKPKSLRDVDSFSRKSYGGDAAEISRLDFKEEIETTFFDLLH